MTQGAQACRLQGSEAEVISAHPNKKPRWRVFLLGCIPFSDGVATQAPRKFLELADAALLARATQSCNCFTNWSCEAEERAHSASSSARMA